MCVFGTKFIGKKGIDLTYFDVMIKADAALDGVHSADLTVLKISIMGELNAPLTSFCMVVEFVF